jgi:hypothetical protein
VEVARAHTAAAAGGGGGGGGGGQAAPPVAVQHVAMQWLRQKWPGTLVPLVGVRAEAHLPGVALRGLVLSAAEMARIDAAREVKG